MPVGCRPSCHACFAGQPVDSPLALRPRQRESTRTTQLYNRLREELSLDELERIHI